MSSDISRGPRLGLRGKLALLVGRGAAWASRVTGRGSGGMIGGQVALSLDNQLLEKLSRGRRIALVTGTNGKTSTTRMLTEALAQTGLKVASNRGGDNMTSGILAALMAEPKAPYAVLEVDEMHLPAIAAATKPQVIVLLNLSRDQLDRVGEIAVIESRIRAAVNENPQAAVVANVDDPLMTSAAWESKNPVWVAAGKGWNGDSLTAPRTGGAIIYGTPGTESTQVLASGTDCDVQWRAVAVDALLGEIDPVSTESNFARPIPHWIWGGTDFSAGAVMQARAVATGQSTPISVGLPGRANRGNALQAFVGALTLGATSAQAASGIAQVRSVAGRYASLSVQGREIRMLLAKNPAGWMESLTMLDPDAQLIVGVNGQIPDGTDLSWLWDVDFEALRGRRVVATGERGADLQVRLNYAGIETAWASNVEEAIRQVEPGPVDALLNYTCFRDARADFVAKGYME